VCEREAKDPQTTDLAAQPQLALIHRERDIGMMAQETSPNLVAPLLFRSVSGECAADHRAML
jgi:hypothetical protein